VPCDLGAAGPSRGDGDSEKEWVSKTWFLASSSLFSACMNEGPDDLIKKIHIYKYNSQKKTIEQNEYNNCIFYTF
jgi:hypothetical protein